jgi:hypothetical protein
MSAWSELCKTEEGRAQLRDIVRKDLKSWKERKFDMVQVIRQFEESEEFEYLAILLEEIAWDSLKEYCYQGARGLKDDEV